MELERVPLVVRDVVMDAVTLWPSPAQTAEVELNCRITDVPQHILGDAGQLRQVIVNLVGNALKFARQGEVLVDVSVETVAEGQSALHFLVRDTGIGVPADKQSRIFESFSQADASTTRRSAGPDWGWRSATNWSN